MQGSDSSDGKKLCSTRMRQVGQHLNTIPPFLSTATVTHQTSRIRSDSQIHGSECVAISCPQQSDGQTSANRPQQYHLP